jgi:hypothetical protein
MNRTKHETLAFLALAAITVFFTAVLFLELSK